MSKSLLLVIAIALFLPNVLPIEVFAPVPYDNIEKFDIRLSYLNTLGKLEAHVDSLAIQKKVTKDSFEYVHIISDAIKYRFYHGFSHFSLSENWLAALTGILIKHDHACKVLPEAIMANSYAACSQQEIVMMAILRKKNIPYRPVFFPHHYAIEVFTENRWFYFDPNMEPKMNKQQRSEKSWNHQMDSLKKYYDKSRFSNLDYSFGIGLTARNGTVNEIPAPNARLFQTITGILSKTLWCLPLLLLFYRSLVAAQVFRKIHAIKLQQYNGYFLPSMKKNPAMFKLGLAKQLLFFIYLRINK